MPTPNDDQRRDDNPGNPWAPPWPDEIARKVAKREIRSMREVLAAKDRHPTGRRNREVRTRSEATG